MKEKIKGLFKNKKVRAIVFVVILIILALIIFMGSGLEVEMTYVDRGRAQDYTTGEGQIKLGSEYHIVSEVSGQIEEICIHENEEVKADDVIIKINSAQYEAELASAESSLSAARVSLAQTRMERLMTTSPDEYVESVKQNYEYEKSAYESAEISYKSDTSLYNSGLISKYEYEDSKAAYEAAKLSYKNAENRYEESKLIIETLLKDGYSEENLNDAFYDAQEEMLEHQMEAAEHTVEFQKQMLDKCNIKAGKDGVLAELTVKNQSAVVAGEEAAVVNSHEGLYAEADVLTTIAPYIEVGNAAAVTVNLKGKNEVYTGVVEEKYDYASKGVSALGLNEYRVHVKVKLDENEALYDRDGYGATIKFILFDKDNCLIIPVNSVFTEDGQNYVYVVNAFGFAQKKPITTEYIGSSCVVVSEGLNYGDDIIANSTLEGLEEGAKVK